MGKSSKSCKEKYYILEPLTGEVQKYLEDGMGLEYVSSDLSSNPEGYVVYTDEYDIVDEISEMKDMIKIHEIPDSITKEYDQYDTNKEFISYYWDGNIWVEKGIVMKD